MGDFLQTQIRSRFPAPFLILALLLHLTLYFVYVSPVTSDYLSKKDEEIKVKLTPKLIQEIDRQIVHTEKNEEKKAEDAKYLSHSDNAVKKETKSKNTNLTNIGARGRQNARDLINQFTKKKSVKNKKVEAKGSHKFSFDALNPTPQDRTIAKQKRGSLKGKDGKTGVTSNSDFLQEIELSDFTQLNTLKYKYYGYFFRIRQRLEAHWGRSLLEKARILFAKNSRVPANENYITQLNVVMNPKGVIKKIQVKANSGISELDDAAIEAFNDAGPFPNPPKGLIKDNLVKIEWGFIVKN